MSKNQEILDALPEVKLAEALLGSDERTQALVRSLDKVTAGVLSCIHDSLGGSMGQSPEVITDVKGLEALKLVENLGFESLDLLDIIFALNKHFKIKISTESPELSLSKFELVEGNREVVGTNIRDVITLVREKLGLTEEK